VTAAAKKRFRSLLFAPANRGDLLAKFPMIGADLAVMDLEDGTPDLEKLQAREVAIDGAGLLQGRLSGTDLYVRVNAPASPYFEGDLAVAMADGVVGVVVPKISSVEDVIRTEDALAIREVATGRSPRKLVLGIETGEGVERATAILARSTRGVATYFGAEDFAAEIGARRTKDGGEILYARSRVVLAARLAGMAAFDIAVVDVRDDEHFINDARVGRNLGYDGKTCVHPHQVVLTHATFASTAEEVDRAGRLIRHYEKSVSEGRGTTEFEGQMIDVPLIEQARQILADAET
jgi:citrate lyase subunit beta / citryl-CoA lyase